MFADAAAFATLPDASTAVPMRLAGLGRYDDSGRDRRRRPRMGLEQTVKLYDPAADRYFAGRTRDVSDRGFCLELPAGTPARTGGTAMVHVARGGEGLLSRRMMVPVRYVWVRRDAVAGRCYCGAEVLADSVPARSAA